MAQPETVTEAMLATVHARPKEIALRWRADGGWGAWTWEEYAERAARLAAGLTALGVERGDRVLLMTRNRPEFHVADMASLLVGAVPISLYNSASPEQIRYAATHSEASVAVVENPELLERFLKVRHGLPHLGHLVVVTDPESAAPPDVIRFQQLDETRPLDFEGAADSADPDDLATLIYTSGTTGPPKAVMITHANVTWTVRSTLAALGHGIAGYRMISFLPMAHIAERLVSHYAHTYEGTEVTTCPEPGWVTQYLRDVRPHLVFAVPRVWEKACSTIRAVTASAPDGGTSFDAALDLGRRMAEARAAGGPIEPDLEREWSEADRMLGGIRSLAGLDECQLAVTAAAPIAVDVLVFFRSLGVPLSELYGLSESCGPVSWDPDELRPGDTGPPIPGCEVRIGPDGEILVQGGNVFAGYLHDPEKTAEAIDAEGWLHTGDIGVLHDGRLQIVGRKKDLIVTSGGENVAPSNIETALRSQPLISQACVAGDSRPYLVALLTIDIEGLREWGQRKGLENLPTPELLEQPELREEVGRQVEAATASLSRLEQVRRFAILDHEWQIDSDELTPTMKMRRQHILTKYAAEIDALYA